MLLSESYQGGGYRVLSFDDATMLWEHLSNAQPDLVLLDAESDGFGTMLLFQDLKQQFPDLAVTVCQFKNDGDLNRIQRSIEDTVGKNMELRPVNIQTIVRS